jgi:hypothetical protein
MLSGIKTQKKSLKLAHSAKHRDVMDAEAVSVSVTAVKKK